MPGARWLFSAPEYVEEQNRVKVEDSRAKGKQFLTTVARQGQTGSNWAAGGIDDRRSADPVCTALGGHAVGALQGGTQQLTRTKHTSAPPWLPTSPNRGPVPIRHVASGSEARRPPPKLLHNPPQMLARGVPHYGGPGTAGREMTSFPYMSETGKAGKPLRRMAAPRGFVAGAVLRRQDSGVYNMDAFRSATAQPRATRSASGSAAVIGPAWKPSAPGKTGFTAGIGAYLPSDEGNRLRSDTQRPHSARERSSGTVSPFYGMGAVGSGPFGPLRNYVSTTAVL